MRILIAPDKFKGALSAQEVGAAVATGLRQVLPNAQIEIVPMADGGEGTANVLAEALGATWQKCPAHGPLGEQIEAEYAWVEENKLAIMEMSEAAGSRRVGPGGRNPDLASTFGVGEMLLAAAERGAAEIVLGLGGSVTNDGGFGMARALGFRFLGSAGELDGRVSELATLQRIVAPARKITARIIAAVDVVNPLLGREGATRVFGPQKGVASDQIGIFDQALSRLAEVAAEEFRFDHSRDAGAGAAGGLGFGLTTFTGAVIRPGFDIVAETVGLRARIAAVDVVITGEGSLDRQTLSGKTAAGVARLARSAGKKVWAVAGRSDGDATVRALFDGVRVVTPPGIPVEMALAQAPKFLKAAARELAAELMVL